MFLRMERERKKRNGKFRFKSRVPSEKLLSLVSRLLQNLFRQSLSIFSISIFKRTFERFHTDIVFRFFLVSLSRAKIFEKGSGNSNCHLEGIDKACSESRPDTAPQLQFIVEGGELTVTQFLNIYSKIATIKDGVYDAFPGSICLVGGERESKREM